MNKAFLSDDSILIAKEIKKLHDKIFNQKNDELLVKDIEKLKELCGDENPLVNLAACNVILCLVKNGRASILSAYSWVTSSILCAREKYGHIQLIRDLFIMDLSENSQSKKLQFSNFQLQHPFIEILKCSDKYSYPILDAIICIFHHSDKNMKNNSMKVLHPVINYIFSCDTLSHSFRCDVWNVLIELKASQLIMDLLPVFSLTKIERGFEYLHVCRKLRKEMSDNEPLLLSVIPPVAVVVSHFIKQGVSPISALDFLSSFIPRMEPVSSLVLIILANTVHNCSTHHLLPVLQVCHKIMKSCKCSTISEYMVVTSVLRWVIQPSLLVTEAMEVASQIIQLVLSQTELSYPALDFCNDYTFLMLSASQIEVMKAVFIHRLTENLPSNYERIIIWLESKTTNFMDFTLFISSLLLCSHHSEIKKIVIRKLSQLKPELHLTTFIFQLAREKDPEIQSKILLSMHHCVNKDQQENKLIIFQILKAMAACEDLIMKEQTIYLYFLFWKVEYRCFPFLQTALVFNDTSSYEMNMTKAKVLHEICKISPDIYGSKVVRSLSDILNKTPYTQPCVLALNAVQELCRVREIDIQSTWKSLKPKFGDDERPEIIDGMCGILKLVPSFYSYQKPGNSDFIDETVRILWHYITQSSDNRIINIALKTLANFRLELLSLETFPDKYKEGAEKAIRTATANSIMGFVHVPGKCWLKFLECLPHDCYNTCIDVFTKWLNDEMSSFRSGIYDKRHDEPTTLTLLQERSLCRSLTDYIRVQSTSILDEREQVVCLCLQILSQPLVKPIPPLKWTFLQNFINHSSIRLKIFAMKLAIRQSLYNSSSAKNIVEAKLSTMDIDDQSEKEIKSIFELYGIIFTCVHSTTLQTFTKNCIQYALNKVTISNDCVLYVEIMTSLKNFLHETENEEINPFLLHILKEQWEVCNCVPECAEVLICCISMLDQLVDRLFPPPIKSESNSNQALSYIKLVSGLANQKRTSGSILRFINCVQIISLNSADQKYLAKEMLPIFTFPLDRTIILFWIKNVMSLIENDRSGKIGFLCSILIKVIIISSGLNYESKTKIVSVSYDLLPLALTYCIPKDEVQNFRTFFSLMLSNPNLSKINQSFVTSFKQCLITLNNDHFK